MKKVLVLALTVAMTLGMCIGLTSCGGSGGENGEVRVYCFGDYLDPELVSEFEEETGIRVVLDTFDTNEEMYPIVQKESASYDVICASDYMIEKMISEGLLSEIDFGAIPNTENIDAKYMDIAKGFDPENKYAIPHTWGTLGIMYNTEEIPKGEITSWNDLWNSKYKQQIVMPDSLRDTLAIALKAKGYSINTTDEAQVQEAADYLKKQKPLVYKYANDSARDLAIGGSASIAVVWNGEILYSQAENDKLDFVIPEEGSEEFMDAWVMPKNVKNKENAQKWLDFLLRKESAFKNYEYLTYSIPNVGVIDKVKDDSKKMGYLFPSDDVISKCEILQPLGSEGDDMYSRIWKDFKSK